MTFPSSLTLKTSTGPHSVAAQVSVEAGKVCAVWWMTAEGRAPVRLENVSEADVERFKREALTWSEFRSLRRTA